MEYQQNLYQYYSRFPAARNRAPPVRWVKEWIPQELAAADGKCSLFRWVREDMIPVLREKEKARELEAAPKPEPTTEILFLCSYEGCGKTFTDVAALRKHANIHNERQHICNYPGCGKKLVDSSKLKRHYLIHTGERNFVCPYEGCGKAFSLDFNLRAHMKTHLLENYYVCPYKECGKRYTNELKLASHVKAYHEKSTPTAVVKHTPSAVVKHTPPVEKPQMVTSKTPSSSLVYVGPAAPARPYECPYEGCGKAYIHEYKLNLHLKREHPDYTNDEMDNYNNKPTATNGSSKRFTTPSPVNPLSMGEGRVKEKSKSNLLAYKAPGKVIDVNQKISEFGSGRRASLGGGKQVHTGKQVYEEEQEGEEEDSEETEDADGNGEVGWGYGEGRNRDYEETDDED